MSAKLIYNSLILSHVSYGLEIYGTSPKCRLQPLEILCNKILRTLQNINRYHKTKDLYLNFNTLPLSLLFKFSILKIIFKCVHLPDCTPTIILSKLQFHKDIHSYATKSQGDFHFSNDNPTGDPLTIGTQLWNFLPRELKSPMPFIKFKKLLKTSLMQNYVSQ